MLSSIRTLIGPFRIIFDGCIENADALILDVPEDILYGPLTRYAKSRVAHAPGMPGTFSPPPWVSDSDIHHGTCVTHVPWCMPGSLTSGFLCSRWRGKRSRHSRRMRNPQFCVSRKKPMMLLPSGPSFNIKTTITSIEISIIKIRRQYDRFYFLMWIPMRLRFHLSTEDAP